MAPREAKVTPKVQRAITKTNTTKKPILPTPSTVLKKTMSTKSAVANAVVITPRKGTTTAINSRQRTQTVPTPKPKENKPVNCPGSVTKSAKKAWKRRPKPAHSGVPVPEKMKRILQQQLEDSDCSL